MEPWVPLCPRVLERPLSWVCSPPRWQPFLPVVLVQCFREEHMGTGPQGSPFQLGFDILNTNPQWQFLTPSLPASLRQTWKCHLRNGEERMAGGKWDEGGRETDKSYKIWHQVWHRLMSTQQEIAVSTANLAVLLLSTVVKEHRQKKNHHRSWDKRRICT